MKDKIVYKSYYKDFFYSLLKKKGIIIPSIILLLLFITGMIFCNFIDLEKVLKTNLDNVYSKPSFQYPFGTNVRGQNLFYIVFIGVYKTLLLAFIATFINVLLGVVIGLLWGMFKKTDSILLVIKNFLDNVPLTFFCVIIVMILGDGFAPLLLVLVLFGWIDYAYIIRNLIFIIKDKDYNVISKLYKVPLKTRAINNYLPSILPILFNNITLCIPKIIALEITISYFGFSFSINNPSLGMIIYSTISLNSYFNNIYLLLIPFSLLILINFCVYFINKTISNEFSKGGI